MFRKLKKYAPTPFKAKDSVYDKQAADNAVAFIECLSHTKGTWAGQPFLLIDWQERIIRDVFGTLKPNGYRQFNTAYIEIPKKNGKSELAAAVALLLTCGDNEERAEVYGCAADRQQASIVFEVAKDMVTMCPALAKRVKILASQKRLVYLPTGSYYQVLSADVASKHGFNTHGVIFGKMNVQISIAEEVISKDAEGFAVKSDNILAYVHSYREGRHGSQKWVNRAAFSDATDLFRFRTIPGLSVTTEHVIQCDGDRYEITSVEDVKGRGMYLEVLAKRIEAAHG